MAACQDERSDLRELAELVTHDESLATHVLRVANSSAFAPKVPILSLKQRSADSVCRPSATSPSPWPSGRGLAAH